MTETLLEKAKKTVGRRILKSAILEGELIELALAWLKNDVGCSQINAALGRPNSSGNYLYYMAVSIKKAYQRGLIKITDDKKTTQN